MSEPENSSKTPPDTEISADLAVVLAVELTSGLACKSCSSRPCNIKGCK
jgi:hypothetical protein